MSRAEAGPASLYHRVVVYLLFAILVLPLIGTFVYSIASSWSATVPASPVSAVPSSTATEGPLLSPLML